jgi:hypothetical protein
MFNRFTRVMAAFLVLGAVLAGTVMIVEAQVTGNLAVTVRDQTGAVVPEADVSVRHLATGTSRAAASDLFGLTRFAQLSPGQYEVKVEVPGFSTFVTQVGVNAGATTSVPVVLEVGRLGEEVLVSDVSTVLNTTDAQLRTTVESQHVTELPLTGRSVLALASTAPGITPVAPKNPFLGMGSFNSQGGRGRGNNITLDSATATDVSTTGGAGLGTVPLDAIKEVNLISNNFGAEYGRNASAQLQILTQSGTNEFHGRLFHFLRNDKLNSRDYFDRTGKASVLRDNNWGAVVGGAAIRDRLFYLGTYEQQKIRGAGGTRTATVLTPAQVSGNVHPTSRHLLQLLQVPTDPSGTVTNPAPLGTNSKAFSGRMDLNLTERDYIYARVGTQKSEARSPGLTFINSNLPTNGASSVNQPVNATISYTRTFSPRTVNQFLTAYGRSAPNFSPLYNFGGPEIGFQDGTAVFGTWAGLPQGRIQNTFQYMDQLTHIRGRHQFKLGYDLNRIQANSYFDANVRGTFTFLTRQDFLDGRPFQYTQRFGNSVRGNRVWNHFFFVQDDIKAAPTVTINLGLRGEVAGGVREINGILSNMNLNKQESLGGGGTGPLGGFDMGGSSFETNWNWAPRLGLAWNPGGGKFVIRTGYGIAYDFIFLNPITNMRFLPPFMYQFGFAGHAAFEGENNYAALVAGTSPFQQSGFAAVGGFPDNVRNFGAVAPVQQDLRNPQVHQWNLTLERDIGMGMVARGSYVGTKGNFLQRSRPLNLRRPDVFTPPQTLEEEAQMRAAGIFAAVNSGLNVSLTGASNRIDPRFNAVTLVESSANSNYHSGQFFLSRRMSRGYGFQASYTFSKSIDDISDVLGVLVSDVAGQQNPLDNRSNRAVSAFDTPHRFVFTHTLEPQLFQGTRGVLRGILHGWQFNGIFQVQSGFPVNVFSGSRGGVVDPTLLGGAGALRPNLVGTPNIPFQPNPGGGGANPNLVTGSGLEQPLVGHFGTLGRNVFRINRSTNTDWTVGKFFDITEQTRLQFQLQVYNVFNNTVFSRPGTTLSAPATFGYYSDTDFDQRNMTVVLRFIW